MSGPNVEQTKVEVEAKLTITKLVISHDDPDDGPTRTHGKISLVELSKLVSQVLGQEVVFGDVVGEYLLFEEED